MQGNAGGAIVSGQNGRGVVRIYNRELQVNKIGAAAKPYRRSIFTGRYYLSSVVPGLGHRGWKRVHSQEVI